MKKKIVGTILAVLMPALIFAATQYFPDIIVKGSPWYDVRGYSSLATAMSAVGVSGKTMLILGDIPISTNTNISAIIPKIMTKVLKITPIKRDIILPTSASKNTAGLNPFGYWKWYLCQGEKYVLKSDDKEK